MTALAQNIDPADESNKNWLNELIQHSQRDLFRSTCREANRKEGDVVVAGMVQAVRAFKEHTFIVIRDRTEELQAIAKTTPDLPPVGAYVACVGTMKFQPSSSELRELHVSHFITLGRPARDFPFVLNRPPKETLETMLDGRVLSMRSPWNNAYLRIQSAVGRAFRESLEEQGFCEIHTPKIVEGGTEGGAQVFTVNYFERIVSLAQSPQLYKQLAAAALERVYEIGAVYRAENSNTSRHLTEFTGLDLEMAFIRDEHDVMDTLEQVIRDVFVRVPRYAKDACEILGVKVDELGFIPRIPYREALKLVKAEGVSSNERNLDAQIGEVIKNRYKARACFLYDYPEKEKPFYIMPRSGTSGTHSFDLLIDGLEICSGGQRIHDYDLLTKRMEEKGLDPQKYSWFLEAFLYGMPPHGGCGLGLERLSAVVSQAENVRQTCLFSRDVRRTTP